jgi:hypothetical protein
MIGRGPGLVPVEDPGLNSPLRISYIIPGSRYNIIGKDEVHWSSVECMVIEVVVARSCCDHGSEKTLTKSIVYRVGCHTSNKKVLMIIIAERVTSEYLDILI